MTLLQLLSIAFFLLASTVTADSCVSKPCGSDYRVTSWNPVREGSYSVYYYEVVTDGCVGVVFTDVLVQMSLSCQNCSTVTCYNSYWDVVRCPYSPAWVTSDAFFKSKGITVTTGLQWTLPSSTALRFSINVNPSTTSSAQGKIYTKGNSWSYCNVIVPVCNCNVCPPCPNTCYRSSYATYPSCTCNNCTACVSGTYQVSPCNTTSNAVCLPCRQCVNNTYQTINCSTTTNRVCTNCTQCVNNKTYVTRPCSGIQNTICTNCTQCVNNMTYETAPCNTTSNRVCTPCHTCIANTYQTVPCTTTHDRLCTNCTQCVNNMTYETVACNAVTNRVCANCTECVGGQYESLPCNITRNRICTNCTQCVPGGSFETVPCGSTTNRVCQNCTICQEGFYSVAPCNTTSDTTCQRCSNCSANEQVLFPCNATHDVVCQPCPECANCSALPNSHLTNNGLNCTCNEGYSLQVTELGQQCTPTPCCADCQSCGFNDSVVCLNPDADLCNYTCDLAPQCTEGTTPDTTGYTINYLGLTTDAACCSAGGGDCSCFTYQLATSLPTINLDDFILGIGCDSLQQCDPNGLIPPPCLSAVLRDGTSGTFFITFPNQRDPYTDLVGVLVPNLGIVQDFVNITLVFEGHLNESSIPVIFSAGGQSLTSEGRACLISSIGGPACVTCPSPSTTPQEFHEKTLQGMEEIEDITDSNSGNVNGNIIMALALTIISAFMFRQ